ncbi:hypothetical protein PR048_027714 [Dryococelus australis]|uniref:Uncharacterized protein n=1 Tax=Dryococelus australis TaxID=614101 RepID=A0ABQ9GH96_9NEOP|nr:hypothetical protein PR048_027714 [Dryococelus australis]
MISCGGSSSTLETGTRSFPSFVLVNIPNKLETFHRRDVKEYLKLGFLSGKTKGASTLCRFTPVGKAKRHSQLAKPVDSVASTLQMVFGRDVHQQGCACCGCCRRDNSCWKCSAPYTAILGTSRTPR